jgi:hypothetical protein
MTTPQMAPTPPHLLRSVAPAGLEDDGLQAAKHATDVTKSLAAERKEGREGGREGEGGKVVY